MVETGTDLESDLFLFRAITKTKKREVLRSAGSLSYGRLSDPFKCKLEELGYPASKYGLHSLRAGGGYSSS